MARPRRHDRFDVHSLALMCGPSDVATTFNPALYGTLLADYDAAGATASGGRVTLVTDPVGGYDAAPSVPGAGPVLMASNPLYGNKPTFNFATGNATASDNLKTAAGLGAAMGASAVTLVVIGHTTNGARGYQYWSVHQDGRFGIVSVGSAWRMYGSVNDIPIGAGGEATSPGVLTSVFKTDGNGRYKINGASVAPVNSLGAPSNTGVMTIGNYASVGDLYVVEGQIARFMYYLGDIGDVNMDALNDAIMQEYGL